MQEAVKTEINKKQYGLQKRNLGIWPLSFPILYKAWPQRIINKSPSPNLRAQVARELAMEAYRTQAAPPQAGRSPESAQDHRLVTSEGC